MTKPDLWAGFLEVEGALADPDTAVGVDIHLSQTTVNNAQLCGGKILYRNDPLYNHTPSEAMSYGTMAHGMAELDLLDLMDGNGLRHWTPKSVERLWADGLANERDGSWLLTDLATRERINKSVNEALTGHILWRRDVLPTLGEPTSTWLVEERVTRCLGVLPDGRAVWFGGTADLVDEDKPMIFDWKTSGRKWDQSKADAGNQASYYTWLYDIPDHEYHVYSRKDKMWDVYSTSRTPEQVDAALRNAWMVAKSIADGSLVVNPWASTFGKYKRAWYCSARWCAAWAACEMKSINDNVWEEQPIDIQEGWQ